MLGLQLLTEAVAFGFSWWVMGSPGLWAPAFGALIGGYLALLLRGQRVPGGLSRDEVKRISLTAGVMHGVLGALAYSVAYARWPEQFEFPPEALLLLAPTLGLAFGVAGLVLTLCAGDAARASLSPRS